MPRKQLQKLYENYFSPNTRGYLFIRNFYSKYSHELSASEFESFEAFMNQIFLHLSEIDFSGIEGPEENYVIKSMYYQCWNTIYVLKKERHFVVTDSSTPAVTDDGPEDTSIERQASGNPGPLDYVEASDLFTIIQSFKMTLQREDVRILNALIDETPLQETADLLRIEYNALCVKIKRLREKLARFLKKGGYENDVTQNFLKKNKKSL